MARVILVTQSKIEIAKRNPAALAAPAHMNNLLPVRQQAREFGASLGRRFFFHAGVELVRPGFDAKYGHGRTSKLVRNSTRTRTPISASAAVIVSSGEWLMPPLPQRTNNMPTSVTSSNITASCPGPLTRLRTVSP